MSRKKRRIFTDEQRAEAVRLVEQSDKSITEVASDLGLHGSVLSRWVKKYGTTSGNARSVLPRTSPEEQAELRELRREVKILRQERDLLKKSIALFVRDGS